MNIILLSGGSGKRLWPLSSGIRAKQFLRVLRAPDGSHESMLQRVFRQISEADIDAPVVISTTDAQKDIIQAQLGNDVAIALEPERRDTFPAIALAAVYLALERHCGPDETVVVMPVDPYADQRYFETIKKMDRAVQNDVADMVLMGMMPGWPPQTKIWRRSSRRSRATRRRYRSVSVRNWPLAPADCEVFLERGRTG